MAVTLDLSYEERNDNKKLTLTDISTDWGTPAVNSITTLTLDITAVNSSNTTTVYDQIDLVVFNALGGASVQADLVFELTMADMLVDATAAGTNDTVFPDGLYTFTYILDDGLATDSELEESVLMEGNVRNSIYEDLRALPVIYNCEDYITDSITATIFAYGYLQSIRAAGYVAKTEELITQLYVLERLLA